MKTFQEFVQMKEAILPKPPIPTGQNGQDPDEAKTDMEIANRPNTLIPQGSTNPAQAMKMIQAGVRNMKNGMSLAAGIKAASMQNKVK